MPDITMCEGVGCPIKTDCYRYLAVPDSYQSYFMASPYEGETCRYYWKVTSKSELKRLNIQREAKDMGGEEKPVAKGEENAD